MLVPSTGANISGNRVRMSIRRGIAADSLVTSVTMCIGKIAPGSCPGLDLVSWRALRAGRSFCLLLHFTRAGRRRRRCRRCGSHLGLAGLGQTQRLVLDAALFQERRDRLGRDRAAVQPEAAAIQVRDELLGLILLNRIVVAEFLNHASIARSAGLDGIEPEKRPVRTP